MGNISIEKDNPVFLKNAVQSNTSKYRDWYILDELPQGWVIDKTAGAPAPNTVFITNGKSVISGKQERALLKIESKRGKSAPKNNTVNHYIVEVNKMTEKTETPIFPAKTVNDLARLKFQSQLLKEIRFDLAVCEIEGWDKKQYINQIKKLLNSINTSKKNKANPLNQPNLFSSVGLKY